MNLYEKIRKGVHKIWDPIGVAIYSEEMGEYDSYIFGIYELVISDASVTRMIEYLWSIETDSIGLDGDREHTEKFAHWLCNLKK